MGGSEKASEDLEEWLVWRASRRLGWGARLAGGREEVGGLGTSRMVGEGERMPVAGERGPRGAAGATSGWGGGPAGYCCGDLSSLDSTLTDQVRDFEVHASGECERGSTFLPSLLSGMARSLALNESPEWPHVPYRSLPRPSLMNCSNHVS